MKGSPVWELYGRPELESDGRLHCSKEEHRPGLIKRRGSGCEWGPKWGAKAASFRKGVWCMEMGSASPSPLQSPLPLSLSDNPVVGTAAVEPPPLRYSPNL